MPFEDSMVRGALNKRARRARPKGEIPEAGHPIRPDDGQLYFRDEARFTDISDLSIPGFGTIDEMRT